MNDRLPNLRDRQGLGKTTMQYTVSKTALSSPLIVIISGHPCTGKTTLGTTLGAQLRLPFVYKDGIKELLCDRFGWSDRERSRSLSLASYDLLFHFIGGMLKVGHSVIVEANFKPDRDADRFKRLIDDTDCRIIEIHCSTERNVLLERFQARADSGTRHPGHLDDHFFLELQQTTMESRRLVLNLGDVLDLDTTDFAKIDYVLVENAIKARLAEQEPTS